MFGAIMLYVTSEIGAKCVNFYGPSYVGTLLCLAPKVSVYCTSHFGFAVEMYRSGIDWHRQNLSVRPSKWHQYTASSGSGHTDVIQRTKM